MSKKYSAPPAATVDPNKKYSAAFNTSRGEIVCELFAKDAPKTVNNFVFLARDKFYDGTVFHRVLPDFMIQGGAGRTIEQQAFVVAGGGNVAQVECRIRERDPAEHRLKHFAAAERGESESA